MKIEKIVTIIPSFATQDSDIFYRSKLTNHAIGLQEFSDTYKLGLSDETFGDANGELFGPHWADGVAQKGNIVILTDFMIVLYIPNHLTEFQYLWLINQKQNMQKQEEKLRAIIYQKTESEYISKGLEDISKTDLIYQYIEEKYNKNKTEQNRR